MSDDQFLVAGRQAGDDEMTSVSRAFGDTFVATMMATPQRQAHELEALAASRNGDELHE